MKAKQILFVLLGLALIGGGVFFGRSHMAQAALKDGQKFDDWQASCTKDEKTKKSTCLLNQEVKLTQDSKEQIIAIYQIGYFTEDKTLKMLQILPLGVVLSSGTSILANETLIAPGKFTICLAEGCRAVADISPEALNTILSSPKVALALINGDGKQVHFPISTKGLKEGLDALAK